MPRGSSLARIVSRLEKHYGPVAPPPAHTAFALVLWEKVAYLATDAKRAAAFALLKDRVGLTPEAILAAAPGLLREACSAGGSAGILERVDNMRDAAAWIVHDLGGSLDSVLALPMSEAVRNLRRIRGIGLPGAERILLLMRAQLVLAPDSNAVRTLIRLGYGAEHRDYSKMYASVVAATRSELVLDYDWLIDAHVLLRHHGQELCKRSAPRCDFCPVKSTCAHFAAISRQLEG